MIKFITATDVLPLRSLVLRDGKLPPADCFFENDDAEGAFHVGYFIAHELVCVASFHPVAYQTYPGKAYQLRGMATAPQHRGKGIGAQLVNFALTYLRGQQVNYVWCNARQVALSFYQSIGFEVVSAQFDVPGIGPHYAMYLKIR